MQLLLVEQAEPDVLMFMQASVVESQYWSGWQCASDVQHVLSSGQHAPLENFSPFRQQYELLTQEYSVMVVLGSPHCLHCWRGSTRGFP
jgi:hypothetical protein